MATDDVWYERDIVFFDGVCNFCNGAVLWLLDRDKSNALVFAPLQGETYSRLQARLLQGGARAPEDCSTIVFWSKGRLFLHSAAVLRILLLMGGFWRGLAALGFLVPPFARDFVYRAFARRRYVWFGRSEMCRMPSPELRAKFLP
jgi:predicted DCC family thiol-disulfide oxidoreductase YuxK